MPPVFHSSGAADLNRIVLRMPGKKKLVGDDSTALHQILDAVATKTEAVLDQKKQKARSKEVYLQRRENARQRRQEEKKEKIVRDSIYQ